MLPVTFTLFPDLSGRQASEYTTTLDGLTDWLRGLPEYPSKAACPLISMARYGDQRTANDSLRHDANIIESTGAIGDYDAGTITPTDAAMILEAAGIDAVVVTTPSHGVKGNRWRVVVPFSRATTLEQRHALLGKANTLLGGILAGESFTASQSFYVGRVVGVEYAVHVSRGVPVDQLPGIDDIPVTARPMAQQRTGSADPLAMIPKRATGGIDQIRAALAVIPNPDRDWERWNRIGMAVFNASSGSPEGLEAWREWSSRCPGGGDTDSVDARWAHYHRSPPTEIGMGSLMHLAGGVTAAPANVPSPPTDDTPGPELLDGYQFMVATQQIEHFTGCVYVQDVHRVFTPRGVMLKPEQFKATYGGWVFTLDATNDKTTRNAWEAFIESQAVRYPIAESQTFRPELLPGALVTEEGRRLVNTYVPAEVDRVPGDVRPFLDHLARILPDDRDRKILLSYMAACVQHIGVKFQWAPLLQGVEGNGKTLFTRCVSRAVGMKFCHFPKAAEIGNKFNSWMVGKVFIGVEDVYYPDHKADIIQSLLPLITNDYIDIEYKGVDQITTRVCANFMLNANKKDALRKTKNDRRFCMFFTAQQHADDLTRDMMDGDYFPELYNWLKNRNGYAHVAHFLNTYPIADEFNPAGSCHRAPTTSTTAQAISQSVGSVEQEIMEAIDEERVGFAGGWVSSMALDRLLEGLRKSNVIPPNRRREIMQSLGYDWHPALRNGRVNNVIALDGGKPKLFIKTDHPDRQIQSPATVAQAYQDAQNRAIDRNGQ